jgi:MFS family permease
MAAISSEQDASVLQRAVEGGVRTFAIVAGGQFVSLLGSQLTTFAMGTWVYQQTMSVTVLGLVILAASLPGILVSPLAGAVADRSDRRLVMILSDSMAAAATLLVAAMILAGRLQLWEVFVLAVVNSAASAFQWPAYSASVPLLVPKRHLGRASGFVQFSQAMAQIVAPALGGMMMVTVGLGAILLTDLSTFVVAVAALLAVRIPRPVQSEEGGRGTGSLFWEAAAGWRYLRLRHGLMALLILFGLVNFLVALVNVLYFPLVLSFSNPAVLGTTLTIGGTGMLVGSIAVMGLGVPKRKVPAMMGLIFLGGVVIAMSGLRRSFVLVAANGFVMMFVLPVLQSTSQVLWQTKVSLGMQGRVLALGRLLAQASLPAAYLTAGPLADHVFEPLMREGGALAASAGRWIGVGPGRGIGLMFVLAGVVGCLLAAAGWRHPRIRHLEQELPDMIGDTPA